MLAKGRFFINEDELKEVLGIPKEAEIIGFSRDAFGGIDMELRSAEEIDGFTAFGNMNTIRRVGYKKKDNYVVKIDNISVNGENSKEIAEKIKNILEATGSIQDVKSEIEKNWKKTQPEVLNEGIAIWGGGNWIGGTNTIASLPKGEVIVNVPHMQVEAGKYVEIIDLPYSSDSFDSILDTAKSKHGERK